MLALRPDWCLCVLAGHGPAHRHTAVLRDFPIRLSTWLQLTRNAAVGCRVSYRQQSCGKRNTGCLETLTGERTHKFKN